MHIPHFTDIYSYALPFHANDLNQNNPASLTYKVLLRFDAPKTLISRISRKKVSLTLTAYLTKLNNDS